MNKEKKKQLRKYRTYVILTFFLKEGKEDKEKEKGKGKRKNRRNFIIRMDM